MYAIYGNNRHIGYALRKDQADQIVQSLYYFGGVSNPYAALSKYEAPKKWADKWLPVFYIEGPTYWGRFIRVYNKLVTDALNERFYSWSMTPPPYKPAATTRDVGDVTYARQQRAEAKRLAQMGAEICADTGRRAIYDSNGNFAGCR